MENSKKYKEKHREKEYNALTWGETAYFELYMVINVS